MWLIVERPGGSGLRYKCSSLLNVLRTEWTSEFDTELLGAAMPLISKNTLAKRAKSNKLADIDFAEVQIGGFSSDQCNERLRQLEAIVSVHLKVVCVCVWVSYCAVSLLKLVTTLVLRLLKAAASRVGHVWLGVCLVSEETLSFLAPPCSSMVCMALASSSYNLLEK